MTTEDPRPRRPPGRPQEMKPVPARLLEALHEAGRTSSREDGRYSLSRIQVRGQKGQVIATDGKVAVIFGKFAFPFAEEVLVPAVPLFGCPEVRDEKDVQVPAEWKLEELRDGESRITAVSG